MRNSWAGAKYRDKFHRESNRSISQHKSTDISCIRLKLSTLICRQEYTSQHQITIFIKRFSSGWTNRCFYTDKRRDWAKVWSICWENFYPNKDIKGRATLQNVCQLSLFLVLRSAQGPAGKSSFVRLFIRAERCNI